MNYSFVTVWKIEAPRVEVWQIINEPEQWPEWWEGVTSVQTIEKGDALGIGHKAVYTWKSILPYTLSFQSEVTRVERYAVIEGKASGELTGYGKWTFSEENGITTVRYDWNVTTTKLWMNLLSFLLKPAFSWNHDVVMRKGGEGLARKLTARLLS